MLPNNSVSLALTFSVLFCYLLIFIFLPGGGGGGFFSKIIVCLVVFDFLQYDPVVCFSNDWMDGTISF